MSSQTIRKYCQIIIYYVIIIDLDVFVSVHTTNKHFSIHTLIKKLKYIIFFNLEISFFGIW